MAKNVYAIEYSKSKMKNVGFNKILKCDMNQYCCLNLLYFTFLSINKVLL